VGRRTAALVSVVLLAAAGCGTRLSTSALSDATAPEGPSSATVPLTTTPGPTNPASDVGVTATEIRVGLIVSKTSVLGTETFSAPMYGALAYVDSLDAKGGIAGRNVKVIVCDDGGTGAGNRRCVRKLIDDDRVFAFVGNSIFDYAGASYVDEHAVPDVGGQPIGYAYEQYRHLYSIYGSSSPRNGQIGYGGKLTGGTEVYRYFKVRLGSRVAGVVYYNQSDSERFANLIVSSLVLEGYQVVREQVDFSVPNYDAAAIDMKARRVDTVFDALDSAGNVRLCAAMDANRVTVKAKVMTVQGWNETVRSDYRSSPNCRNSLYATALDRNYMDTQYPPVAQFRADMARWYPDRQDRLSMWTLEGWASAQWFTDAAAPCGAQLTRACVEAFLNRADPYDGRGLLIPRNFVVEAPPSATAHNCLNVAQWQDSAYGGKAGWLTRTPDMGTNCFDVFNVAYTP